MREQPITARLPRSTTPTLDRTRKNMPWKSPTDKGRSFSHGLRAARMNLSIASIGLLPSQSRQPSRLESTTVKPVSRPEARKISENASKIYFSRSFTAQPVMLTTLRFVFRHLNDSLTRIQPRVEFASPTREWFVFAATAQSHVLSWSEGLRNVSGPISNLVTLTASIPNTRQTSDLKSISSRG